MDAIDGGFKQVQESEYEFTENIQNALMLGMIEGVTRESMATYLIYVANSIIAETWEPEEDGD